MHSYNAIFILYADAQTHAVKQSRVVAGQPNKNFHFFSISPESLLATNRWSKRLDKFVLQTKAEFGGQNPPNCAVQTPFNLRNFSLDKYTPDLAFVACLNPFELSNDVKFTCFLKTNILPVQESQALTSFINTLVPRNVKRRDPGYQES